MMALSSLILKNAPECWRILQNAPNSRCSNKVFAHPLMRQPELPQAVDREWGMLLLDALGQRPVREGENKKRQPTAAG